MESCICASLFMYPVGIIWGDSTVLEVFRNMRGIVVAVVSGGYLWHSVDVPRRRTSALRVRAVFGHLRIPGMMVIASLLGGRNQHCRRSLSNHTVPTPLANVGRSKIIPLEMGQALSIWEVLGGQMQKGPSRDAGVGTNFKLRSAALFDRLVHFFVHHLSVSFPCIQDVIAIAEMWSMYTMLFQGDILMSLIVSYPSRVRGVDCTPSTWWRTETGAGVLEGWSPHSSQHFPEDNSRPWWTDAWTFLCPCSANNLLGICNRSEEGPRDSMYQNTKY